MSGHIAESAAPRTGVAEALAAWEAKGPTSLTVALVVDALYGVREALSSGVPVVVEFGGLTHRCDDPDCHVAGFVATLKRNAPARADHASGGAS